ncbi:MAG: FAD-dependent oxidoreductase [Dehalobacterium sp.]
MSKLYTPGKIGRLEIKNRVMMPAMHLAYCPGGEVSNRLIEFYRLRAQGGVGLIVAGAVGIDPLRINEHDMIQLYHDRFIPGLSRLTKEVHRHGTKIFPQLFHAGRYARSKEYGGKQAVAPSAVASRFTGEMPRELREEEILEIVEFFSRAAHRAKEAGFDGVEISASAGYLISQFLSPVTNQRVDRYGGNLERRMTFPLEVIAAVRQAVGEDFPIMVRVAGNDFIKGGNSNVEAKLFCAALEQAGVDAISVTGGWHETHVPQLTMDVPPGAFAYLGETVKSAVNIPVVVCNRIDVRLAEEILDHDRADFVGIARGLVADPDLVHKAEQGKYEDICPCIGCNQGCMDNIFFGKKLNCLVNPEAGREIELMEGSTLLRTVKTDYPKKILVIGAGIAGLEFGKVAAERGHHVTIWEEGIKPGGQALIASLPPGRRDFLRLIDYLTKACLKLKVKICYGKKAYADEVLKAVASGVFDQVVIAAGAKPSLPDFPIDQKALVVPAWDVLSGKVKTRSRVVIVGAGAVGVETALFLAETGTIDGPTLRFLMLNQGEKPEDLYQLLTRGCKDITLVEMGQGVGKDIGPSTRWSMLAKLKQFHVKIMDQTKVVAVNREGVLVEKTDGQELIPADTVILAGGACSNDEVFLQLKEKTDKISIIGDAKKPRKMLDAVREAYEEALRVSEY